MVYVLFLLLCDIGVARNENSFLISLDLLDINKHFEGYAIMTYPTNDLQQTANICPGNDALHGTLCAEMGMEFRSISSRPITDKNVASYMSITCPESAKEFSDCDMRLLTFVRKYYI